MGGTITLAVRYDANTLWSSSEGWTNSLPWTVQELAYSADPAESLRTYCGYYPPDGDKPQCFPNGYGLVVFDLVTKTLLHFQGYSHLVHVTSIFSVDDSRGQGRNQELYDHLEKIHDKGRLYLERTVIRGDEVTIDKLLSTDYPSLVEFIREASDLQYNRFNRSNPEGERHNYAAAVDISPWTIEEFEESAEGFLAFKARLLELDFNLSPYEHAKWQEFIASFDGEEEDDEDEAETV